MLKIRGYYISFSRNLLNIGVEIKPQSSVIWSCGVVDFNCNQKTKDSGKNQFTMREVSKLLKKKRGKEGRNDTHWNHFTSHIQYLIIIICLFPLDGTDVLKF